ncbi:hypothetical protein NEISICOT_00952 [Neisseria sicca ATCC 29256]|uniref:Uncharacterized protein n=1 Tax=Neisseria sicca ATCC 29256 TaxID=547045 RepID=C6M361_NEISI|nr:hypothetical protein NEISICOT_00952 [Neisseria sicca ATCC 29256]
MGRFLRKRGMSKSVVMGRVVVGRFSDDPIINQNAWDNGT